MHLDFDHEEPIRTSFPYLVFIHGAGGDKTQWDAQKTFFANLGWGTVTLSLPGHGNSPTIDSVTILAYARILHDFLIDLNIANMTLVGHSMGGAVILQTILNFETVYIDKIVLIGTGAKLKVTPIIFDLIETDYDAALLLTGQFSFHESTSSEIKKRNYEVLARNGSKIFFYDLKACDHFDIRSKLPSIRVPALIICGEDDQMTPVKYSSFLNDNLRNSLLEIIPNASHLVFQEAPRQVNQIIYEFQSAKFND